MRTGTLACVWGCTIWGRISGKGIFIFPKASRAAPEATTSRIQKVLEVLATAVNWPGLDAQHSSSFAPRWRMSINIPPEFLYAFIAPKGQFYLFPLPRFSVLSKLLLNLSASNISIFSSLFRKFTSSNLEEIFYWNEKIQKKNQYSLAFDFVLLLFL